MKAVSIWKTRRVFVQKMCCVSRPSAANICGSTVQQTVQKVQTIYQQPTTWIPLCLNVLHCTEGEPVEAPSPTLLTLSKRSMPS